MKQLWLVALIACGSKNALDAPVVVEDGPSDLELVVDGPIPDAPALAACANPVPGSVVTTREVARNLGSAMLVTAPAGDTRLYVVVKGGSIRIVDETETLLPDAFLDLSDDVGGPVLDNGELGMLGLAFHPGYHVNRLFYVYYTRAQSGDATYPFRDVVARCKRDATDPNKAELTCTEILAIKDYAGNHNGGMIEFGADGFLYIGTGDGGLQNDPDGNGQTLVDGQPVARSIALLGKFLRIDVDHPANGKEYGIPTDNPYAVGGAPEIFMRGFRNPWRWSFDRATGDMWIGDVGQSTVEEIHYVKAGTGKAKNFGWDNWDGTRCFPNRTPTTLPCDTAGFEFPQDERTHATIPNGGDGFEAIIGGQVYRGTCFPDLVGTYFYTDNRRGGLSTAKLDAGGTTITKADLPGTFPVSPASIHAAATGELYVTTTNGTIHRIEAGP